MGAVHDRHCSVDNRSVEPSVQGCSVCESIDRAGRTFEQDHMRTSRGEVQADMSKISLFSALKAWFI